MRGALATRSRAAEMQRPVDLELPAPRPGPRIGAALRPHHVDCGGGWWRFWQNELEFHE
jgi:hypothetical protein